MLCDHPRRLIFWTDYTQHSIVTDGRHQHRRQDAYDAGQVVVTCLECGHSDAYDGDDLPTWVGRVMSETAPAQWGTPTYRAPRVKPETHVTLPPRADAEGDGA